MAFFDPLFPSIEATRLELQRSFLALQQKLRKQREIDNLLQIRGVPIIQNEMIYKQVYEKELADRLRYFKQRQQNQYGHLTRLQMLQRQRERLLLEKQRRVSSVQRPYFNRQNRSPYAKNSNQKYDEDEVLLKKYQDGTRAKQYRDQIQYKQKYNTAAKNLPGGNPHFQRSPYQNIKYQTERKNFDQRHGYENNRYGTGFQSRNQYGRSKSGDRHNERYVGRQDYKYPDDSETGQRNRNNDADYRNTLNRRNVDNRYNRNEENREDKNRIQRQLHGKFQNDNIKRKLRRDQVEQNQQQIEQNNHQKDRLSKNASESNYRDYRREQNKKYSENTPTLNNHRPNNNNQELPLPKFGQRQEANFRKKQNGQFGNSSLKKNLQDNVYKTIQNSEENRYSNKSNDKFKSLNRSKRQNQNLEKQYSSRGKSKSFKDLNNVKKKGQNLNQSPFNHLFKSNTSRSPGKTKSTLNQSRKAKQKSHLSQNQTKRLQGPEAAALTKIQKRIQQSTVVYQDSKFRNNRHQLNHLLNKFDCQVKMRKQLKDKINSHPIVLRKHAMVTK